MGYPTPMARRTWVRLFTEDVGAKVLALVIAFVLWVVVSFLGTRTVTAEDIAVGVANFREDLALVSELPRVRVRLRAPRLLLRQRQPTDLVRAFVDLAGRGLGAQSADVVVTPNDARVDVLVVLPSRISFALDPVVQRTLPVKVVPEGEPAAGFRVGEATVEPATVEVRGALGRLQQTPAIEAKVPVHGTTAAFVGDVPLSPPEALTVSPDRVRVKLDIVQAEDTKTLGVRVVTQGTVGAGYWVRAVAADPPAVTVKGLREALADRPFVETVPLMLDGARNPIARTVDLALPGGVTVIGGEPRVQVTVDVVPLAGTKAVTAAVQVGDVPDGLRVTSVSPASLTVTVQGSGEAFERLGGDDARVVISAQGRSAGTFSVRPGVEQVRVPEGVRTVSVEGVDIQVVLEGA